MTYVDPERNREFRQVADGWYRLCLLREGSCSKLNGCDGSVANCTAC
jgi:hypothetical protein